MSCINNISILSGYPIFTQVRVGDPYSMELR